MIYQVQFFVWVDGRATYKKKQMKVEDTREILPKLKKSHKSNFISIQKIGI
jgi:hypothetical protein